jgi:hypothetical protein
MMMKMKLQVFMSEVVLFGIPLLCFCSLRIYQVLSQHTSIVSVRLNKTREQIRNEKSILKAIVIQALIPVICSVPTAYILLMVWLHGWNSPEVNLTIFRYGENQEYQFPMILLCDALMVAFTILDPFITLLVVKSYRKAANRFFAKFKIYRKVTALVFEETMMDTVHVRLRMRSIVPPS